MAEPREMPLQAPVRITDIKVAPLVGETPKGGWSTEIKPEDSVQAVSPLEYDLMVTRDEDELLVQGRAHELGPGFAVRRVLPSVRRRTALAGRPR